MVALIRSHYYRFIILLFLLFNYSTIFYKQHVSALIYVIVQCTYQTIALFATLCSL